MTNVLRNDVVFDALFSKYSALGDELEARLADVKGGQEKHSLQRVKTAVKKEREAVARAVERLIPPAVNIGDVLPITTYSYDPRGDFCEGENRSGCVVEVDDGRIKVRIPAQSIAATNRAECFITATWEGKGYGWVDIASDEEWLNGNCY